MIFSVTMLQFLCDWMVTTDTTHCLDKLMVLAYTWLCNLLGLSKVAQHIHVGHSLNNLGPSDFPFLRGKVALIHLIEIWALHKEVKCTVSLIERLNVQ